MVMMVQSNFTMTIITHINIELNLAKYIQFYLFLSTVISTINKRWLPIYFYEFSTIPSDSAKTNMKQSFTKAKYKTL